jgi:hypothetical protein
MLFNSCFTAGIFLVLAQSLFLNFTSNITKIIHFEEEEKVIQAEKENLFAFDVVCE